MSISYSLRTSSRRYSTSLSSRKYSVESKSSRLTTDDDRRVDRRRGFLESPARRPRHRGTPPCRSARPDRSRDRCSDSGDTRTPAPRASSAGRPLPARPCATRWRMSSSGTSSSRSNSLSRRSSRIPSLYIIHGMLSVAFSGSSQHRLAVPPEFRLGDVEHQLVRHFPDGRERRAGDIERAQVRGIVVQIELVGPGRLHENS